jgi:dihydrofolate reductase
VGRLVVTEFVTLDGVAQGPGGPEEDDEGGFAHGGWQAPLIDEDSGNVMFEQAQHMDALLLGRKTFEIFAGYWPTAPADMPFTALLNGVPKYVASRTLSGPLGWSGSTLLEGEVAEAVAAVKARHEQVHVIGSLDLVQTLLRADLVDQLELWLYPLILGSGKRVVEPGALPTALTLDRSTTFPNGTIELVYTTEGRPTYGDMAAQDEARFGGSASSSTAG